MLRLYHLKAFAASIHFDSFGLRKLLTDGSVRRLRRWHCTPAPMCVTVSRTKRYFVFVYKQTNCIYKLLRNNKQEERISFNFKQWNRPHRRNHRRANRRRRAAHQSTNRKQKWKNRIRRPNRKVRNRRAVAVARMQWIIRAAAQAPASSSLSKPIWIICIRRTSIHRPTHLVVIRYVLFILHRDDLCFIKFNHTFSLCAQHYQKTYVGISANSVRCIWEQYDSNETEINVDILPVLAEDTSYRLWELGNVSSFRDSVSSIQFT